MKSVKNNFSSKKSMKNNFNMNLSQQVKPSYQHIVNLSKKNKVVIISRLANNEPVSVNQLLQDVPLPMLSKELEILEYYKVITVNNDYVYKGEKFGEIDIDELPAVQLFRLSPLQKMIVEVLKRKECMGHADVCAMLALYGIKPHPMVVTHNIKILRDLDIIDRIHLYGNRYIYRVKYNVFIPPPDFETKVKEAIEYMKRRSHARGKKHDKHKGDRKD